MLRSFALPTLLISAPLLLPRPAAAEPPTGVPDPSPEAQSTAFVVPEGFEINLWAAEPLLRKPVQINWDAAGRLWAVCSTTYPQIKPGEEAVDQVVILEDSDGDGRADKSTLFAEDLHIPTALLPVDGGCYVANSTEILFLKDTDGDGRADLRKVVLSGFGTEDTHHLIHTLRSSPEGLLNFNQSIYIHSHVETPYGVRRLMGGGVWNFRPETLRLGVFCKGLVNPWGLEYDRWGQAFATDGAGSEGINYLFPGAVFVTSPGAKRIVKGLNPGQPKHCGLEIIDEPHFPEDWQGTLVTCDFRGNRINRFQLSENGSGYISRQLPDVLGSTHRGFRPVDVRTGPDGALYIADWFNPIIQHGEVDFRDPRRDRVHGRIWRLTAKGRALSEKPDLPNKDARGLVNELRSPRRWNREFARQEMKNRNKADVIQALAEAADSAGYGKPVETSAEDAQGNPNTIVLTESKAAPAGKTPVDAQMLEVAWAKETLNQHDAALVARLVASSDHHIRAAALRILSHHLEETPDILVILEKAIADDHPQVRLWALGCLNQLYTAEAVPVALRVLDKAMDDNLDFLLELMCREQSSSWLPYALGKIKSPAFENVPPRHLIYALRSTGKPEALGVLLSQLETGKLSPEDQAAVIQMAGDVADGNWLKQMAKLAFSNLPMDHVGLLDAIVRASQQRKARPEGSTDMAKAFLNHADPAFAQRGALLAGLWQVDSARGELEHLVTRHDAVPALKTSALQGLIYLGGPASRDFLATLATGGGDVATRVLAINGLTDIAPELGARQAILYLAETKSSDEARPVLEAFLKNKKLPEILAKELEGKTIPEHAAAEGIRLASSKGMASLIEPALKKAGNVRQMDRPLTPEELQTMVAKVEKLGNAARGERVYRAQQLLCISCHAIGETGGHIGPNMVSLGSSAPVDYIIESLLEPSKKIKEGYHMTMVTTKDGQVFSGAIAQDGGDELVIRDAGNNLHKVAKASIAQNIISPISMMPPGLTASLREDEFLDLVKFLSELGREGAYKTPANRYIRTWRTMGAISPADIDHVRHVGLFALNDRSHAFPWELRFSMVNGEAPLFEVQPVKMHPWYPNAILQCDLEMAAAGKVTLKPAGTANLLVTYGDKILTEISDPLVLDLPAGKTVVTFVLTKDFAGSNPFWVEIVDGPVQVVTTP